MVGTRPNKLKAHEEAIRTWMETIVRGGGVDRYDDLHVDQIDSDWKAPKSWISAALESFELAVGIRNEIAAALSVVLAFSLQSGESPLGVNFNNAEELRHNFHVTPPSLYLLRPGTEFWTQQAEQVAVQNLDPLQLFTASSVRKCIFMEFKRHGSEDYTRSLFLVG